MIEPTRDALHAETLRMLREEADVLAHNAALDEGTGDEAAQYAYVAECVREVAALREQVHDWENSATGYRKSSEEWQRQCAALRAENARLAASAAIVDAMDAGRIAAFSKRKDGRVALYAPEHLQDFDAEPFVADTTLAAYAKATATEGTDAKPVSLAEQQVAFFRAMTTPPHPED